MSILADLEELRDIFLGARKAAFTEMIMVPQQRVNELMDRIVKNFPIEFEQASEIISKSKDIISTAQEEARKINPDNLEIARNQAETILSQANIEADRMKTQTLSFIQKIIADSLISIRKADSILQESLEGVKDANL
jgi:polyhydroxyalkanoate synthesis regulator phasin